MIRYWHLQLGLLLFCLSGADKMIVNAFSSRSLTSSKTTRRAAVSPFYTPTSSLFSSSNNKNDNDNFLASIPRPTVSQLLSAWITWVSGHRLIDTLPKLVGGEVDGQRLVNAAINGLLWMGAVYTLVQSLAGIDYSNLEDLDTKSWARQAGQYALAGIVPTEYRDPTTTGSSTGPTVYQVATFAGGCFWGTELRYQRQEGVMATAVGFTQGRVKQPNYEQVCSGSTGHTEGIQVLYDPAVCSYERLVTILLDSIDPTLQNQVGNDRGTQYRHGIYPHTLEQMEIAEAKLERRQAQYQDPIVTEVKEATVFWPAENYHQRYLEKGGQSAEKNCEETVRCYG